MQLQGKMTDQANPLGLMHGIVEQAFAIKISGNLPIHRGFNPRANSFDP